MARVAMEPVHSAAGPGEEAEAWEEEEEQGARLVESAVAGGARGGGGL